MTTITGFAKRNRGDFAAEGTGEIISYDNVRMFFVTDEDPDIIGSFAGEIKLRFENLSRLFGSAESSENFYKTLADYVGKKIVFHYMLTKKVPVLVSIEVLPPKSETKSA